MTKEFWELAKGSEIFLPPANIDDHENKYYKCYFYALHNFGQTHQNNDI